MFAHKNYKSPPSKIGLAYPHVIWAKNLTKPLANSEVEVEVAVETVAKAGVSQIKFKLSRVCSCIANGIWPKTEKPGKRRPKTTEPRIS